MKYNSIITHNSNIYIQCDLTNMILFGKQTLFPNTMQVLIRLNVLSGKQVICNSIQSLHAVEESTLLYLNSHTRSGISIC